MNETINSLLASHKLLTGVFCFLITYTQYLYDRSLCIDQGRLLCMPRHHDWRPTSQLLRPRSSSVDRSTFDDAVYSITPTILFQIQIQYRFQLQIQSTLLCRPGQNYTMPNSRQNYTMPNSGQNYTMPNSGQKTNNQSTSCRPGYLTRYPTRVKRPISVDFFADNSFQCSWITTWLRFDVSSRDKLTWCPTQIPNSFPNDLEVASLRVL